MRLFGYQKNKTSIEVTEQIRYWKEKYNIGVYGGPYDPKWSPSSIPTPIYLEFESKEAFVLWMMEWG